MSTEDHPNPVGSCPNCTTALSEHNVLIQYEKNGRTARWAECPECGDVVDPRA